MMRVKQLERYRWSLTSKIWHTNMNQYRFFSHAIIMENKKFTKSAVARNNLLWLSGKYRWLIYDWLNMFIDLELKSNDTWLYLQNINPDDLVTKKIVRIRNCVFRLGGGVQDATGKNILKWEVKDKHTHAFWF